MFELKTVPQAIDQPTKKKVRVVGEASLNLAEFACVSGQKEFELSVPLSTPDGAANSSLSLCVSAAAYSLPTSSFMLWIDFFL